MAAGRAKKVMGKLASEKCLMFEEVNKRTHHGELRIDNCKKFDLGGGYRLICVKQGRHLIILYVGTHDDCDRWLENNRGLRPCIDEVSQVVFHKRQVQEDVQWNEQESESEMDYDEILMEKVTDRVLEKVFRGLRGK